MPKVIALSNTFSIISQSMACNTAIVEYAASTNAFDYDYDLLGNPTQKVRLDLNILNPQNVVNEKIYRQTNGVFQNNNVKIDKTFDLQTGYFDDKIHDALSIACKHQTFKIDNIEYSAQGSYERDERLDPNQIKLTMAKIKIYEQGYNKTNLSC